MSFRKAPQGEDRDIFDRVLGKANRQAEAGLSTSFHDPSEALFVCVFLENKKEIRALRREMQDHRSEREVTHFSIDPYDGEVEVESIDEHY